MKQPVLLTGMLLATLSAGALADTYTIDSSAGHASVNFKVQYYGYSWLVGRFDHFNGQLEWNEKVPENSTVSMTIDTNSIDSDLPQRDQFLQSTVLDAKDFPTATFRSTEFKPDLDNAGKLTGELTLHGVTHTISFPVKQIGEGKTPDGVYRAGFEGMAILKLKDFGIAPVAGASGDVIMEMFIEGVRKA